jgi:hypothetical protein
MDAAAALWLHSLPSRGGLFMKVATIGLDIAKHVFQLR